jgi:hypothetical protein
MIFDDLLNRCAQIEQLFLDRLSHAVELVEQLDPGGFRIVRLHIEEHHRDAG